MSYVGVLFSSFPLFHIETTETATVMIDSPKLMKVDKTASIREILATGERSTGSNVVGEISTAPIRHVLRGGEPAAGAG